MTEEDPEVAGYLRGLEFRVFEIMYDEIERIRGTRARLVRWDPEDLEGLIRGACLEVSLDWRATFLDDIEDALDRAGA